METSRLMLECLLAHSKAGKSSELAVQFPLFAHHLILKGFITVLC